MRRRTALIAPWRGTMAGIAVSLAACTPAPVAAPPPAVIPKGLAAPATAAATVVEAVEPPVAMPPMVVRLTDPACAWSSESWRRREVALLRLRVNGPVFAQVMGGRVQVQIPVGVHEHGMLDVGSEGLVVAGVVAREQVTLFAARAFAMNGVVFPTSRAPLSWTEGFADGVTVTTALPREIVAQSPPVVAKRLCSDLTLDRGTTLDLAKEVFGQSRGNYRLLSVGRKIEVFSDPTRPAEVKLMFAEDTFAQSFKTLGAYSSIGVAIGDLFVAGWVKTAHLKEARGGPESGVGGGGFGMIGARIKPLMTVTCAADVPIAVEVDGERATVGYILAPTPIEIRDRGEPFTHIQVKNRNIHVDGNARLLARASDLLACRKLEP